MGRQDITLNECLQRNDRYADCFNAALGYELVRSEHLEDVERIQEGSIHFTKAVLHYKKERDGIREYHLKNGVSCAIVCIENQGDIDYAQAVRHMIYDAYGYNRQLTDIRKSHAPSKMLYKRGFYPDDRLIPMVTVCLYYGIPEWDAPTHLKDLFDYSLIPEDEAKIWQRYIQDYEIVVLDIRRMSEDQLEHMHTDMKLLFGLLRHSDEKKQLQDYILKHRREMSVVEDDICQAYMNLSGTKELRKYWNAQEGGSQDMCKAMDEWIQDSRAEGKAEGIILSVHGIMTNLKVTAEQALEVMGITGEEKEKYLRMI